MPSCLFVADAPTTLDAAGTRTSWVQVAKQGEFADPRYGKFEITQDDFDRWLSNFQTLNQGEGKVELAVDVDHGPEKRGETEAAGWFKGLEQRGVELWAEVEWNDLGIELIESKRYRYLSPSYQHNFRDETGKTHGTALVGAALTNRPFLTMAAVTLSAVIDEAVTLGVHGEQAVTLRDFTTSERQSAAKSGAAMADGSFPIENRGDLQNAVRLVGRAKNPAAAKAHIVRRAKAIGATDALPEGWGVTASDSRTAMTPEQLKALRDALGLDEGADDATILAKAQELSARPATPPEDGKTLSQLATEQGCVVLSAADHAKLAEAATSGAAAAKQLHQSAFDAAFDKALEKGQVVPAEKDDQQKLYDAAPEVTLTALAARQPVVNVEARGAGGGTSDPALPDDSLGQPVDDDRLALHTRAVALQREHNIDYVVALDRAAGELGVL